MSVGVVLLDPEGEITYVNRKGVQYLARLEEAAGIAGPRGRQSRTVAWLFETVGTDGAPQLLYRETAAGKLQIMVIPFAVDSRDSRRGRLVIIEEPGGG